MTEAGGAVKYILHKNRYFEFAGYQPHQGQRAVHESAARHRVVVAGRRSGKTVLAAREAECTLLQRGKHVWIVAPTHDLTDRVFREIWHTFVENPKTRCKADRKSWSQDRRLIRLRNGSFVEGKTALSPASLVGEGLDLLIFDEAAKADPVIWERYLRPTLSDRRGRALFITTPEGRNWVYDLWLRGHQGSKPATDAPGERPSPVPFPREWESFQFGSGANPLLEPREIEQARRELSEDAFRQEYLAEFVTFAARVYWEFDETECVRPCPINRLWPLYRAVDFGYRNPSVCLWLQMDPEDRIYVVDEFYATHRTAAEMAEEVLARDLTRPPVGATYCDPAAAEQRAVLRRLGIPTYARPTLVAQGIEEIRSLLKRRPDGTRGLIVAPHCTATIREFHLYRYPGEGDYGSIEGGLPQDRRYAETPLSLDNHAMDALRYAVMGLKQAIPNAPVAKPAGW